jgi:hypothetical protein
MAPSCSYQPECSSYPSCSPCWDGTGSPSFCGDSNINLSIVVTTYNASGAEMAGTSLGGTLACSAASTLRNLADIVYNSDFLSIPSNTNVGADCGLFITLITSFLNSLNSLIHLSPYANEHIANVFILYKSLFL